MSGITIACDNSIISDLRHDLREQESFPEVKKVDLAASKELVELSRQGVFRLGVAISTGFIEAQQAGGMGREILDDFEKWPVAFNAATCAEIDNKSRCLHRIIQDKDGIDSRNVVVSMTAGQTAYYLTTDYKYLRQFKAHEVRIRDICKFHGQLLSPSEFLKQYKEDQA